MAWHVVSFPSSASRLLPKNRAEDFSPVQKIGAAIRFYTSLPLPRRLQLAREYAAHGRAKQGKNQGPACNPGPSRDDQPRSTTP
jgi:hypothetical protein